MTRELDRTAALVSAILWLLAAGFPVAAVGDDAASWDRYVRGTIAEVVDGQAVLVCGGAEPEHPVWTIPTEDHARKAVLTYTGLSRPMGALRREMLSKWLISLGQDSEMGKLFEREYLFHERGGAYWVPVQAPVAAYFSAELEPNGPVLLYLVWAGAHCADDRATWLFLANEFEALEVVPSAVHPSVT